MGSFYRYTNRKLNGSNGIAPLRDGDGKIITSCTDKAVLLNNYFSSVFTVDNGIIDANRLPKQVQSAMPCVCYTPDLVLKYIRSLKTNSSAGPDGLPAVFFKETDCLIALPLSMIFNLPLQEGVIPDI